MIRPALWFCLLVLTSCAALAGEPVEVAVDDVLCLGPLPLPLPAFHDADKAGVSLDDLATEPTLDVAMLRPRKGDSIPLAGHGKTSWRQAGVPVTLEIEDTAAEAWLAFYVRSDRWQETKLTVDVPDSVHLKAWLNGEPVELKDTDDTAKQGSLELTMGVHLVLLRTVAAADLEVDWTLAPTLERAADLPADALSTTTDSRRVTDIDLILDTPHVRSASISPDGTLAAIRIQERPGGGDVQNWLEIRDVKTGDLVTTWRGGEPGGLDWAPDSTRLSFTLRDDDKTDLWLFDIATGETSRLLRGIEHMGGYKWAPNGRFVVYSVRVEAEKGDRKVKRIESPADRQPGHRDRSYLVMAAVPEGITRRLTAGPLSPGSWSISPDSRKLLFFLGDQDLAGGRPYFSSELWELDLETFAAEKILDDRWIGGAEYGPKADVLLLQGSPSAFDGLGRNLPADVQANDYGGQLYLYDRGQNKATPLTMDLVPAVGGFWWSLDDGLVYALCTDTQFHTVWRCNPKKADWSRVDTGVEYTNQFDLARKSRTALARGTSVTTPNKVYSVDLKKGTPRLLLDPGVEHWADVAFGTVTYWKAPLPDGESLDGRIYWPADHDPAEQYPVIVYYYGGTSPVTVDFGGRYPKNVWAGQGYIVYVPEPSGATGYGQEFAARHVNDWGKRTAWEVIESTKAFLAAHPSADPDHVGCIGASYGGFLTEYVITQTDMFAAAASHAGISSISSYWGEGLWGYVYGARALADAFPWSDRDLYIEQSALFHADKIHTPLLLVHGDGDTNVPVGESDQLFTALKLLGREVEYVQIQGQDHWILDHDQRIVWNDTILAFFAKWLKDRDGWWEALYPEE